MVFDDIAGIESVQNLLYAARAIQLAADVFGIDLETAFEQELQQARSNIPEQVNGHQIYETRIQPAVTDLRKVAAHYALSSLFEHYAEKTELYCYTVYSSNSQKLRAGRARMTAGRLDITSKVTLETASFTFCATHLGDHNVTGGVRDFRSQEEYQVLVKEVEESFNLADLLRVVRLLDRHFEAGLYSLKQLFRDEQRKIAELMLKGTLAEVEKDYQEIYEPNVPLMRFLEDMRVPLPRAFELAAQFVINTNLKRAIEREPLDLPQIMSLLQQGKTRRIELDASELAFQLRRLLGKMSQRLSGRPGELSILSRILEVVKLVQILPFPVDLWDVENVVYEVLADAVSHHEEEGRTGRRTGRLLAADVRSPRRKRPRPCRIETPKIH